MKIMGWSLPELVREKQQLLRQRLNIWWRNNILIRRRF